MMHEMKKTWICVGPDGAAFILRDRDHALACAHRDENTVLEISAWTTSSGSLHLESLGLFESGSTYELRSA